MVEVERSYGLVRGFRWLMGVVQGVGWPDGVGCGCSGTCGDVGGVGWLGWWLPVGVGSAELWEGAEVGEGG